MDVGHGVEMKAFRYLKVTGLILSLNIFIPLVSNFAYAKVALNAECYMKADSDNKDIQGTDFEKEFALASTSKVVTSFWAINKLGAKYRFTTRFHVTSVAADTYDVHIEGDADPYFGQQMMYFMISELNKQGIRKIENLTFDENFFINWNVAEKKAQSARSYTPQPDSVRHALESSLVTGKVNGANYKNLSQQVKAQAGITMVANPSLQIRRANFVRSSNFTATENTKTFALHSAPLYRYLKFMNLHSNNYMADMLFYKLGGREEFKKFAQTRLDIDDSDISFVNGSGDSVYEANTKLYNKASCATMVKVLYAMKGDLEKQGLGLQNMMSVAGTDNSTLGGRYAGLQNAVIAKTGSVDPAIALTGMISTGQGQLLFAVMMKTGGPADWTNARNQIRSRVSSLISSNGGTSKFKYTADSILPMDRNSGLAIEVADTKKP